MKPAGTFWRSPLGWLRLEADLKGLTAIQFAFRPGFEDRDPAHGEEASDESPDPAGPRQVLAKAAAQLDAYFARRLTRFDLPLAPAGTPFQLAVWTALLDVPWGATISYGELARRVGRPRAARAVGAANRANPIPIIIPCHRVVGARGDLVGYAPGIEYKRRLLELEGVLGA